jgi:hypothetical protein
MQVVSGCRHSQALYVAAKLAIAGVIGDGAKSSDELAKATDSQPAALRRLLRVAGDTRRHREDARGHFRLTPVGALLRRDVPGSRRDLVP